MLTPRVVLSVMVGLIVLDSLIGGVGAYLGHEGMFAFGVEVGKFTWAAVVGAAASAFSAGRADAARPPDGQG